jgi:ergothioneine biosynthesis protein EgtB
LNFKFNHFDATRGSINPNRRRLQIKQWFQSCRSATLALFDDVDADTFCRQVHPDFSPVGWHLGHIIYTESLWLLERCAGLPAQFPEYHRLFAQDGLPKTERQHLPCLDDILDYEQAIRRQVFAYLDTAPIDRQEQLWRFLLQHESQHNETITLVLQLQRWRRGWGLGIRHQTTEIATDNFGLGQSIDGFSHLGLGLAAMPRADSAEKSQTHVDAALIHVPAGAFAMGDQTLDALDNESPAYEVWVDEFWIDRYPVTCADYERFIASGGYQNAEWWTEEGWRWLQTHPVAKPLYWSDSPEWANHPVCGVSWYEADAYARFVGKRLPTEAEWEKAARWQPDHDSSAIYPWGDALPTSQHCNHDHWIGHTTPVDAYPKGRSAVGCDDMLGNVWEWTADWFRGYPQFTPYPYVGYSQAYFDDCHKVLRGGSWATRPWGLRCTFRNWYHPDVRQIFAGFRCAV